MFIRQHFTPVACENLPYWVLWRIFDIRAWTYYSVTWTVCSDCSLVSFPALTLRIGQVSAIRVKETARPRLLWTSLLQRTCSVGWARSIDQVRLHYDKTDSQERVDSSKSGSVESSNNTGGKCRVIVYTNGGILLVVFGFHESCSKSSSEHVAWYRHNEKTLWTWFLIKNSIYKQVKDNSNEYLHARRHRSADDI